ncbi:ABC transporter ATP-binding protein [Streptosporangium sp. CA-135522]|uniref:ABC transporter ATP-binding protein n=1 Tax=Streptosporangium sp. CA-135522 TaxID=3240072 RepID=UPI003D8CD874
MMTLNLDQISAGHNGGTVVHQIHLTVRPGTVHALVGHNGAGKSTLLDTVAGLIRPAGGRILLGDRDLTRLPAHRRNRSGIGYVPQGARVFATLTVAEHLAIAERRASGPGGWTRRRVLDLLPRLAERRDHRGTQLSGGEQQMLALARALLTQPRLLLLDEPTEGLAPVIVEHVQRTVTALAADGLGILLATPQPDFARVVADHLTVLTAGRVTARLAAGAVRDDPGLLYGALTPGAGDAAASRPRQAVLAGALATDTPAVTEPAAPS